jgi:hypothetical protein
MDHSGSLWEAFMRGIVKISALAFLGFHLLVVGNVAALQAQERFEVTPTEQIPRDYESWSLFLICNLAWIDQNRDEGIGTLFDQYRTFGDVIGPRNLAIWFWKEPAPEPSAELTDVSRSSEYCTRFKLLLSEGPYVLVTTQHPDAEEVGDYFVVRLNGLDPEDSAKLLAKLTDQLRVTGLDQAGLDASTRWQRSLAAALAVVSSVGSYFDQVSFTFNTGFFKAEIAHSGG